MDSLHPVTHLPGIDVVLKVIDNARLGIEIITLGVSAHKLPDMADCSTGIKSVTGKPSVSVNGDDGGRVGHKSKTLVVIEIHAGGFGSVEIDDFHINESFLYRAIFSPLIVILYYALIKFVYNKNTQNSINLFVYFATDSL